MARKHQPFDPAALFRAPLRSDIPDPATDTEIARTEQALAIALPARLKEMLRVRNGGRLKKYKFTLAEKPPGGLWPGRSYKVEELPGVHPTHRGGLTGQAEIVRREWELPDGLIPLCGDGHWWCCLDYRESGPRGEPRITHYDSESGGTFLVAASFEALVEGLKVDPENLTPALVALDEGSPRGDRLGPVLEGLGCRSYQVPGLVPHPSRPTPPMWRWEKYASFVKGLPVCINAENNKLYDVSVRKTDQRPSSHPMLTVSVSPKDEPACLAELLGALGPRAVLIHGVE